MKNEKIDTGSFSEWLLRIRESIRNNSVIEVPCGDCRACCTSSLFIHIKQEEFTTINNIDKKLLFDVPNMPDGDYLMGYSSNGHCPMFANNQCSIYSVRPNTCRNFDCRIFAATGLIADDYLKDRIAHQAERWKFTFPGELDKKEYEAVNRSVKFVRENKDLFPGGKIPSQKSELAILALKVYKVFIRNSARENSIEENKKIVEEIIGELEYFNTSDEF